MTAKELLAIVRADYLDDGELPYNWSDAFLYREIGRAQQQACWRQDLRHLFDTETSAICEIALVSGQQSYALDPRILRIHAARVGTQILRHTTQAALDVRGQNWRNAGYGGAKQFWITGRSLFLDKLPMSGVLNLEVWRGPILAPSEIEAAADDELEWLDNQEDLAHWVAYRAYSRRDEDHQNPQKALEHRALFDATFGTEVPARERLELLRHPGELHMGPLTQWAQPYDARRSFDYDEA